MSKFIWLICSIFVLFAGCNLNKELDIVIDPVVRITNPLDTIKVGETYVFMADYFNNIGIKDSLVELSWSSSDESLLSIDNIGQATALKKGEASIQVSVLEDNIMVSDTLHIVVDSVTAATVVRKGNLRSSSSYVLLGAFTLEQEGSGIRLQFSTDYLAIDNLPGLYVYLSNNPNSTGGAYEIGEVKVFSGAHDYLIPNAGLYDFSYVLYWCKPFNVKVGEGKIGD